MLLGTGESGLCNFFWVQNRPLILGIAETMRRFKNVKIQWRGVNIWEILAFLLLSYLAAIPTSRGLQGDVVYLC
jgi:hypothetical protein